MLDLLLPSTDRVVVGQLISVVAAGGLGFIAVRRKPEGRLLTAGILLMLLAAIALRAVH